MFKNTFQSLYIYIYLPFYFLGFEITIPILYDSRGNHVSHDHLRHHFHQQQQFYHHGNRPRRDTSNPTTNISVLQANVSGFGQKFQIKLWPNKQLLAPGFKVYRRGNHRHGMQEDQAGTSRAWAETQCHYTGTVTSHNNAPASFSMCDGMVSCASFILLASVWTRII